MKFISLCILSCYAVMLSSCVSWSKKKQWVNLLKGKQLNNWVVKITGHPVSDNYKNTFIIKDGVLKVNYADDYHFNKTFGHIFYDKKLTSYKLKFQYRFTGTQAVGGKAWATRNSGVMIHSESPYSMTLHQFFPTSVEVQLLGGLSDKKERTTGNVCTPGTNIYKSNQLITKHCVNAKSKTYYGNQWVQVEIEVYANQQIIHKINGKEVLRYSKPAIGGAVLENKEYWESKIGNPLTSGYICFQSESHPIEFKNIFLLEL